MYSKRFRLSLVTACAALLLTANIMPPIPAQENAGSGTAADYSLIRKSAEAGEPGAMTNLANMYEHGRGVTKNEVTAAKWYRKAADAGQPEAMSKLAIMYMRGSGVAKNEGEALKWFRKAAENGQLGAMNILGLMYEDGRGVKQDMAEALKWYHKSADAGDTFAKGQLKRLGKAALPVPKTSRAKNSAQPQVTARSPKAKQARLAVEGVYLVNHSGYRYINGDYDFDFKYITYVLLKDGTYYEDIPPVSLEEWDIAASRAAEPKQWGRWQRKADGKIAMRPGDANQKKFTLGGLRATPAKPGERLSGVYSSAYSSTGITGGHFAEYGELRFFPDGRFQQKTSSSFTDTGVNGSGVFTHGAKGNSGRYTLSGYTLTFKYDGGKVVRAWFYRPTDKHIYLDKEQYTLGGRTP